MRLASVRRDDWQWRRCAATEALRCPVQDLSIAEQDPKYRNVWISETAARLRGRDALEGNTREVHAVARAGTVAAEHNDTELQRWRRVPGFKG